jgi:hypothetical protein
MEMEEGYIIAWASSVRSRIDWFRSDKEFSPKMKWAFSGEEPLSRAGYPGNIRAHRCTGCRLVSFEY